MHYAGPREALHHTYIRELLGFKVFSIGRDHAGAENNYPPLIAKKFVNENKKRFKIGVFYHNGAYYCSKCKKIVLKGDCAHKNLLGISGTDFRNKLKNKLLFLYARKNLQMYINKLDITLFN
jgi:sulfate adenylyltransferase